jgi:hypothetical protein
MHILVAVIAKATVVASVVRHDRGGSVCVYVWFERCGGRASRVGELAWVLLDVKEAAATKRSNRAPISCTPRVRVHRVPLNFARLSTPSSVLCALMHPQAVQWL